MDSNLSPSKDGQPAKAERLPMAARAPQTRRKYSLRTKVTHQARRLGRAVEVVAASVLPICPNRKARGEVQIGSRTVRYYRHWPDDAQLLAEWDALSQSNPGATVFQSPIWQQATARIPDALAKLRLITVHDNGKLTGVIPLERRGGGEYWSMGVMTTAFHDPLITADAYADTWTAALQGIRQLSNDDCRSITFERLAPDSRLREVVPLAQAAGFTAEFNATPNVTDTIVDLAPTWDAYLAKLTQHDRKELRRKVRKAEEKANAKLVVNTSEADVAKVLPPVLAMMEKDGGAKGRKARWLFKRHMDTVAGPLSRSGRLTVYTLQIDGKIASGIIALTQGDVQMLWNTGMDDAFREWSPGIVLFGMVFRRAIELQQPTIDLLLGLMPYKYSLGAVEKPLNQLVLKLAQV